MKTYSKKQIKEWLEGWRGANGSPNQPLHNILTLLDCPEDGIEAFAKANYPSNGVKCFFGLHKYKTISKGEMMRHCYDTNRDIAIGTFYEKECAFCGKMKRFNLTY
jgi:hypothetical protein